MSDLIKRDPFFRTLSWPRLFDELDDFMGTTKGLKIHDTESDIIAEAVVAGIPASEVDVHIEDGVLTIKAEKKDEMSSFKYYYSAALSGGQWDKATAKIKDGIVKITVPKTESVKPKKIKVSSEE